MRTTQTLDDNIAKSLQELAQSNRKPFKDVVNQALRLGLTLMAPPARSGEYVLSPVSMGGVRTGIDLDKAIQLATQLDDGALMAKLEMRK